MPQKVSKRIISSLTMSLVLVTGLVLISITRLDVLAQGTVNLGNWEKDFVSETEITLKAYTDNDGQTDIVIPNANDFGSDIEKVYITKGAMQAAANVANAGHGTLSTSNNQTGGKNNKIICQGSDWSDTFENKDGITGFRLDNLDVSNVTNMVCMFQGCEKLTSLSGLENWNVSNVTNMHDMFLACESLSDVSGAENWDVSGVTDMSYMFYYCTKLTSLSGLEDWDVSNVTDMEGMFMACYNLTSLRELEDWDVSSVTNMGYMFNSCQKLTNLSGLEKWDISSVTAMNIMFLGCTSLRDVSALKNWKVSNVTSMNSTFFRCANLSDISELKNWDVSKVETMNEIFSDCPMLEMADLSKWNTANLSYATCAFAINTPERPILVITSSEKLLDPDGSFEVYRHRKKIDKVTLSLDNHKFIDGTSEKEFLNTNTLYLPDDIWANLEGGEQEGKNIISYNLTENQNSGSYNLSAVWADIPEDEYKWPLPKTNLKYTGEAQDLFDMTELEFPDGCKLMYKVGQDEEYQNYDTTNQPRAKDAGEYEVSLMIHGGNKYKHLEKQFTIEIEPREKSKIEYSDDLWPTAKRKLIYNGKEQVLLNNPKRSLPQGAKLMYKIEDGVGRIGDLWKPYDTANPPKMKEVGKYEINFKIYGGENYDSLEYKNNPLIVKIEKNNKADGRDYSWNTISSGDSNKPITSDKNSDRDNNDVKNNSIKTLRDIKLPMATKTIKYISGYSDGTFRPENKITRAEFISAVYKFITAGEKSPEQPNQFTDINKNTWYSDTITYLSSKKIISVNDDTFNPDAFITRAEMAQILFEAIKSYAAASSYVYSNESYSFTDLSNPKTSWANEAIKQLASNGIVNGYEDGTFRPDNDATRAEMTAMMARILGSGANNIGDIENEFSDLDKSHWAFKYVIMLHAIK